MLCAAARKPWVTFQLSVTALGLATRLRRFLQSSRWEKARRQRYAVSQPVL
jgi:hypothetical protein